MLIPVDAEMLHYSADYLEGAGLKQVQATHVPAYAAGNLLHPLVDEQKRPIVAPFDIYEFGLAVNRLGEDTFSLRLIPTADKQVSTPIIWPEREDFHKCLPEVGFAALKAVVELGRTSSGSFALFGENEHGEATQELVMPSAASAEQLVHVVSSQVTKQASQALYAQVK